MSGEPTSSAHSNQSGAVFTMMSSVNFDSQDLSVDLSGRLTNPVSLATTGERFPAVPEGASPGAGPALSGRTNSMTHYSFV